MKTMFPFRLLLPLFLILLSTGLSGQIKDFGKIRWHRERIAPGLVWKSAHTFLYDSAAQNINLLYINTSKREVSLLYSPVTNIPVSGQANAAEALAAVNAGFFNIKEGGSVTYIRTGGLIQDKDTAAKWVKNINMNGAIMKDRDGLFFIGKALGNEWYDNSPEYPDVLVTGPLLLENSGKAVLPETSLVIARHPRTAAGIRNRKVLILLTLDGRTDQSIGMTLPELTDMMISLGCTDAVNFDGGGSTTMWIKGKPFNGVVNMPCDNRKFDHEGERPVSDILIVK